MQFCEMSALHVTRTFLLQMLTRCLSQPAFERQKQSAENGKEKDPTHSLNRSDCSHTFKALYVQYNLPGERGGRGVEKCLHSM